MNLTCFVACTSGLDQSKFFDYTMCSYAKKDPPPTDSGMINVPMDGKCPDVSVRGSLHAFIWYSGCTHGGR